MKVIVIGSGLIGVTTAYFLVQRGHAVTVIDRQEGAGLETSFANGALLTPSMAEPWNTPECWRVLLSSLLRSDAPLQLRLHALPSLTRWGLTFLRNSNAHRFQRNAQANLRLALYSLEAMEALRQEVPLDYGRGTRGSLKFFRDAASLERTSIAAQVPLSEGLRSQTLTARQTIELEPALAPIEAQLAGAVHYQSDETGDAYRFCLGLAEHLRSQGVGFHFGTEVSSLKMRSGQVTAVLSGKQRFAADRYVVAAGSYTARILSAIGVKVPVQPAKGYSVTLDEPPGQRSLSIPIIDDALHAAVVPLQGAIRVAGTAEFAGFDKTLDPDRVQNLLSLLTQVLPQAKLNSAQAKPWCAFRALSADGVPIIGHTPIPNLFVNTGHGHLGWTMAAGSAKLLADLISGETPAIDPNPYSLSRFS